MPDFVMHYQGKRYQVSTLAKRGDCVIELPDGTHLLVGNVWMGGRMPASAVPVSKKLAKQYTRYPATRV